jgi:DNA-directed RNA polymerase subunit RPC12/RpoP
MPEYYFPEQVLLVINKKAIKGNYVESFGGFCHCGKIMKTVAGFSNDESYVVVECPSCGSMELLVSAKSLDFVRKMDLVVVNSRDRVLEFLRDVLSPSELETVLERLKGSRYNYSSFNRAKKKIKDFKLDLDYLLAFFQ